MLKSRRFVYIILAIVTVLSMALAIAGVGSASAAGGPAISTDKTKYSLGDSVVISGSGFTPYSTAIVTVLRPDHVTDTLLPAARVSPAGSFQTIYRPPLIPGRYKLTATDGWNGRTASTAVTVADPPPATPPPGAAA